jgi:hypothetical protein
MPLSEAQKAKRKEKKKLKAMEAKLLKSVSVPNKKKPKKSASKAVQPAKVSGSGDYKAGSKTGGKWARTAGLAGDFIDSIFGTGDYGSIKYNTVMDAMGPPEFVNRSSRSTDMRHREFIGNVTSQTSFTLTEYLVSATNAQLFPILANIASNFEQYRVHGMIFEFKTLSGPNPASVGLGYVNLAFQYDVADPAFSSPIEMDNYEYAVSSAPTSSFVIGVECKDGLTFAPLKFVDNAVRPGYSVDPRLSQLGRLAVATGGQSAAGTVLGQLWCTYDIELIKPKMGYPVAVSTDYLYTSGNITAGYIWNNTLNPLGPFGTGTTKTVFDSVTATNGVFTFTDPRVAGRTLLFQYVLSASSTIPAVCTPTAVSGIVVSGPQDIVWTSATLVRQAFTFVFLNAGPWVINLAAVNNTAPANTNLSVITVSLLN